MEGESINVKEARFKEAQLRFCSYCDNKLVVRESKYAKECVYFCKFCEQEEVCKSNCAYFHNFKPNFDKKLSLICRNSNEDPTLPRMRTTCPKCLGDLAIRFHYTETRVAFVCRNEACGHHWADE